MKSRRWNWHERINFNEECLPTKTDDDVVINNNNNQNNLPEYGTKPCSVSWDDPHSWLRLLAKFDKNDEYIKDDDDYMNDIETKQRLKYEHPRCLFNQLYEEVTMVNSKPRVLGAYEAAKEFLQLTRKKTTSMPASASATTPAVPDETTDGHNHANLKKRKEGTMAISSSAMQFDSEDTDHPAKKTHLDNHVTLSSQLDNRVTSRLIQMSKYSEEHIFKIKKTLAGFSRVGIYSLEDMVLYKDAKNIPMGKIDDDVMKMYENFKRFDTVEDDSDHLFLAHTSPMEQPLHNWVEKIHEEWRILDEHLPETIFVRVYKSRMDLLRAVIIGAKGTPYHDGLFFFDVHFPSNYPLSPPLVRYHSGGIGGINPNLHKCGEVCLSLPKTLGMSKKEEIWVPGSSTMLQLLVSIQDRFLTRQPLLNESGYVASKDYLYGESFSLIYNENTLIKSLLTMVYTMNKPPKNFEALVIGHFRNRVRDILMACKAYMEGLEVGCDVMSGKGNQDFCSNEFKKNVAACIKPLVAAFIKIGATEANEIFPPS